MDVNEPHAGRLADPPGAPVLHRPGRFRLLPYAAACLAVPLVILLWTRLNPHPRLDDHFEGDEAWGPTPTEVSQALGARVPGTWDDARHRRFAALFVQRYRSHGVALAVRLRAGGRAQLLCAALIPRWDMARAAEALHREALANFGTDYAIDIYETYLTTQRVKVGELRSQGDPGHVQITFNPPYPPDPSRARPQRQADGPPWRLLPPGFGAVPAVWYGSPAISPDQTPVSPGARPSR